MNLPKKATKEVKIGNVKIGGGNPVLVQSMLNTDSEDISGSVSQALRLKEAGCRILRMAVPTEKSVRTIYEIKEKVDIPLVADIHFDYKLALKSIEAGADKIRINPGNIGGRENIKKVAEKCKEKGIPIRVGVNSGSLEKHLLEKYGGVTAEALVESALYNVSLLEQFDVDNIVISIKASNVPLTVSAYRILSEKTNYPLHLGITEAGTERSGLIKSAVGIGCLLLEGIGDTIRVSLTAEPEKEIMAAYEILRAAGLYNKGIKIISCPTCGRTKIDLIRLANEVEKRVAGIDKDITVAVMGCAVNGPGEAKCADIGIAGGHGEALLFKNGEIIRKIKEENILEELLEEIKTM